MESESILPSPASEPLSHSHKALTVPELLGTIFSWLPKPDLARVARVCRFWTPLALDMIWETIPSFNHLINTYTIIMRREGDQQKQDMSDYDRWDVFWMYCCRVRSVYSCKSVYKSDVIKDIRSQFERHFRGRSLLPNLRSIGLEVWGYQNHLIEVLPIISAELQDLDVRTTYSTSTSTPATVRRILRRLIAIPLDQLSKVSLSYSDNNDSSGTLAKFLQLSRATLVDLSLPSSPLTISGLKQLESFLGATSLTLMQKGAAIELHEFFDVIASSFPNLRKIRVTLDEGIAEDVSVTALGALAGCWNLQDIYVESHRWMKLSREDVYRFGSWWPLMERFNLAQPQYHQDQATNPLEILQDFARMWSRTLRKISLPFDGSAPLPSPSAVKFKFEKLVELDVGPSYIVESNVESVAEFLGTMSSGHLDILALDIEFDDEDHCADLWDAVKKKVNAEVAVDSNVVST